MSWELAFSVINGVALLAWIGLILGPRHPTLLAVVLYLGVGILCLIYSVGLIGIVSGGLANPGAEPGMDFGSIEGIRAVFAGDGGVVVGWAHYLAFDLFVGLWIAKDADAKHFSRVLQAPILLATFLAGPLGLGIWLVVREARRTLR